MKVKSVEVFEPWLAGGVYQISLKDPASQWRAVWSGKAKYPRDVMKANVFKPQLNVRQKYHIQWWRHQMETSAAFLDTCAGNSPAIGWIPHTEASDGELWCLFFTCAWKKQLSKQSWVWNKVWWLCLVPTSTTRFASDAGYRMDKIWYG